MFKGKEVDVRGLWFLMLISIAAITLAAGVLGGPTSATHAARLPAQATSTITATTPATGTPSVTLTVTATPSPSPTLTPAATGTTPPGARVYLPLILRTGNVTVPTPTPTTTPSAPTHIRNGDFEAEHQDWTEVSRQRYQIILPTDDLPDGVDAHSGGWAAWLGGAANELAAIYQAVTVPADRPYISYWVWVASKDSCGNDIGGLGLAYGEDQFEGLDGYQLCEDNSTGGWINRVVSAEDFVGQQVELWILAETDAWLNSNLFVDDVGFVSNSAATGPGRLGNIRADPRSSARLVDMADRIRRVPPHR
jgi:hypothetical protein